MSQAASADEASREPGPEEIRKRLPSGDAAKASDQPPHRKTSAAPDSQQDLRETISRRVLYYCTTLSMLVFLGLLPGLLQNKDWSRLVIYLGVIGSFGTLILVRHRLPTTVSMAFLAAILTLSTIGLQVAAGPLAQLSTFGPVAVMLLAVFRLYRTALAFALLLVAVSAGLGLSQWGAEGLAELDLAAYLTAPAFWVYRTFALIFLLGNLLIVLHAVVTAYSEALLRLSRHEESLESQLAEQTRDLREALTRAQASEQQLARLALKDDLTGLPNSHYIERLYAERREGPGLLTAPHGFAVINIRDFSDINDSFGFNAGNELLRDFGSRLRRNGLPGEVFARVAADEFLALLPRHGTAELIGERARELLEATTGNYHLAGHPVQLRVAIGVACCPQDGTDFTGLYRAAKRAWARAQREQESPVGIFDASVDGVGEQRLATLDALREAVSDGAVRLQFQPILDLRQDRIASAEGLLRWSSGDAGGDRTPGQFLPLAIESGQMPDLNARNLKQALSQLEAWSGQPLLGDLALSFNLTARDLLSETGTAQLLASLRERPALAARLIIEITETDLISDLDALQNVIGTLRAQGVRIAIDDFGVGYSSLARLHRLTVDIVKLDGSFISDLETRQESRDLVRAVVDIAHRLGARVTAEYVQTAGQAALLRDMQCDFIQGEFVGLAMAPEALEALVSERVRPRAD